MKDSHSFFTILKPVNLDLPSLLNDAGDFTVPKQDKVVTEKFYSNRSNDDTVYYISKGLFKVKHKTFYKHHAKLYYIIGAIQNLLRNSEEYTPNSYVNLWSKILLKIVGEDYKSYINILIKFDIIEANKNENGVEIYSNDKGITKAYRLTEKYRKAKCEVFKVEDYGSRITKKLKKEKELTGSDDSKKLPYLQHVYDEFSDRLDTFDFDNAKKYIDYCRDHQITLKDKTISKDGFYYVIKNRVFDDEVKKDYLQKVIDIQNKKIYFKQSSVNRVHNNYTELPVILVPFIKDATGYSMIELDNSASIITMLYKHLSEKKAKYYSKGIIKNLTAYEYELSILHHTLSYTPDQPEKKDIYQLILSKVNRPDWTRDDIKEKLFATYLFQKTKKDTIVKQAFTQLFPELSIVINHIQQKGNKVFSRYLMKLESKVFQQIWKRIPVEIAGCSWIPKHDAILTDRDSTQQVKEIMIEELSNFTGLKAWVKDKDHQQTYDEIIQNLESMKGYSSMKKVEYQSKVSSNVTEDMRLEKRIERLEKAVNTEIDENDLFDTIYKQSSIEQLEQINVNKNNTNDMNINQAQKEEVELSDYDSDQDTVEDITVNTFERKYDPVKGYYYEGYSPNIAKIKNPNIPLDSIELNGSERWYLYEIMFDYYNDISSFTWDFTRNRKIDYESFFGKMSNPDHHTKIIFSQNIMVNVRDIILRAKQKELVAA